VASTLGRVSNDDDSGEDSPCNRRYPCEQLFLVEKPRANRVNGTVTDSKPAVRGCLKVRVLQDVESFNLRLGTFSFVSMSFIEVKNVDTNSSLVFSHKSAFGESLCHRLIKILSTEIQISPPDLTTS
jgi:hypothetical protein